MPKSTRTKEGAKRVATSTSATEEISFIPTGCTLLDCILGGGWGEGRIANIIGNPSSGKTLIAMESAANFLMKYPENSEVQYIDAEHAFDSRFAESLGIPLSKVAISDDIFTVEGFEQWLDKFLDNQTSDHAFIILDSLDALSDEEELAAHLSDNVTIAKKARQMSRFFRTLTHRLKAQNVTLLVVSQVREKVGVSFGANWSQSGGKALEFYMSQRVFLRHMKRYKKSSNKIDRIVGVQVEASCEKNKVGVPFRKCKFPVLFDFGIDDIQANLDFASSIDEFNALTKEAGVDADTAVKVMNRLTSMNDEDFKKASSAMATWTYRRWQEIESSFRSSHKKYGS